MVGNTDNDLKLIQKRATTVIAAALKSCVNLCIILIILDLTMLDSSPYLRTLHHDKGFAL